MNDFPIVIVGAGFSGLAMGIALKRAGIDDFVILEKAGRRRRHLARQHLSRAPRATCRRTSTRSRSSRTRRGRARSRRRPEILAYLEHCADEVRPARRTSASAREVDAAPRSTRRRGTWTRRARAAASRSTRARARARQRRAAPARAARHPRARALRGQAVPLGALGSRATTSRGKRVAVIGTGASAIQFVPADRAAGRAAPRLPAHAAVDRAEARPRDVARGERWLFERVPGAHWLRRTGAVLAAESRVVGFAYAPKLHASSPSGSCCAYLARAGARSRAAREAHARLPARLQARPDLERLLPGAAARRTSSSSPSAIDARSRRAACVTADGRERAVDAIVCGTGFRVARLPVADRRSSAAAARRSTTRGATALRHYLGITVTGLPEPVPADGPEHRARPQLDDLHDRGAGALRDAARSQTLRDARARVRSTCARAGAGALQRARSSAAARRRCGAPAARAGT